MKEKVEDSEKKSVQKPLSVMMVDARNELVKAINDISRKKRADISGLCQRRYSHIGRIHRSTFLSR